LETVSERVMKIVIVAGGTGGHLFPAIRLVEELKLKDKASEVLFVTSCRKQDRAILRKKNIMFKTLPLAGLSSKNAFFILNFIIRLIVGSLKGLFLLLWFRPRVVVGFGSYVSGPMLLFSSLFRIKTIIHEQNVYPGKTNRILANFVNRIAVSFPETLSYLKKFEHKVVISGNPLRRELKRHRRSGDKFTILAMGGSQGAHTLNRVIPEAVGLIGRDKKDFLEVIHVSGYKEEEDVARAYRGKGVKNRVFPFRDDIHALYNESDFVIARSGATTISELLYLAKPAILIPYPYLGAHQHLNARVLEKMGSAILLEESRLAPELLRDAIIKLMDRNILIDMSQKVKTDNEKDPCDILIREIIG